MLDWFYKEYRKHNDTPILLCNFGMTPEAVEKARLMFDDIFEVPKQRAGGWFYKPSALLRAPVYEKVWIDTDIHVLGDISGIFNYIEDNKLAMVEDRPWTKRRGEKWHNSGVVGVRGKPPILVQWTDQCKAKPSVGDQEVLHEMVRYDPLTRMRFISDVPNIYNWLRLQVTHDNENSFKKLCMHWTGEKGKNEIRKMIYNG
jgi:hypothetical protein